MISKLRFDAQVTVELSVWTSDAVQHFGLFLLTSLKLYESTFSNDLEFCSHDFGLSTLLRCKHIVCLVRITMLTTLPPQVSAISSKTNIYRETVLKTMSTREHVPSNSTAFVSGGWTVAGHTRQASPPGQVTVRNEPDNKHE